MRKLIEDVIHSLKALCDDRKADVRLICPDSILLLHADKDLIRQVIYNLLSNAIKFAESRIDVFLRPGLDDMEVRVLDDGEGVDERTKDLLFDKFYQSRQSRLQKPEGSGLGLAICKKIIELHNGKISVENNEGKGACFIFTVPLIH